MLPFGCNRDEHFPVGRRELLKVGGMTLIGTGLEDLLRLEADAVESNQGHGTAKSVVFIYQSGGPSQHETFDPKPEAPDTVRGEYKTTQTRLPGVHFCEYLPKLAARADKFSLTDSGTALKPTASYPTRTTTSRIPIDLHCAATRYAVNDSS